MPTPVTGGHTWQSLEAGGSQTCGVAADRAAHCWGSNNEGQVGNGSVGSHFRTPQAVVGGHVFARAELGPGQSCAMRADDGRSYCWGRNDSGQVGDGTDLSRTEPVPVGG